MKLLLVRLESVTWRVVAVESLACEISSSSSWVWERGESHSAHSWCPREGIDMVRSACLLSSLHYHIHKTLVLRSRGIVLSMFRPYKLF